MKLTKENFQHLQQDYEALLKAYENLRQELEKIK